MKIETQDDQSSLLQSKQPCRLYLYGQNPQYVSTLKNNFAGMKIPLVVGEMGIEVSSTDTVDEGLSLVLTNYIHAIVFELSTDPVQGLHFREKIREDETKRALPILFIMPENYWCDVDLLGKVYEDPYSFALPDSVDFKTLFTKLKTSINFEMLHIYKNHFDRNMHLAHHLQQTMLPPWVYFGKSYEFSTFYLPHNVVGGDLVEWFPLDDERVLFIFGDISGHDTYSALAMSTVHSFVSHLIEVDKEKARRPCLIANEIHAYFRRHFAGIVSLAALIGYFDFRSNYLCYLNAGYENLICFDSLTGKSDLLNPDYIGNMALGGNNDSLYTENDSMEYWFSDFSVFMFFSDGLTDLSKDIDGFTYMDKDLLCELVSGLVMETRDEEKSITIPFRCYQLLQQHGYLFPQDDLTMGIIRKPLHLEKEFTFACRVPADNKSVDEICEKSSAFVSEYYQDERLSVDSELLLEEYLVNVIMHGLNEYEKLYDFIAIRLHAYDDKLKLMIWDRGKEWNGELMQKELAEDILDKANANLQGSGRGLPIISTIASQGSRQRFSGLNETIFFIPKRTGKEDDVK